jgi:molecular chaperone GrpE (heat shock protein)
MAVLLVIAAGAVALVIVRRSAARHRIPSPSRPREKEGLAAIAEAVVQLRAVAADLGEPGRRVGELAAAVEAAGDVSFSEQRAASDRMRRLLGELIAVSDEVEDVLARLGASETDVRVNLEFVDELLVRVLASAGVREIPVVVGSAYDIAQHEPQPEHGSAPRGTIMRMERRGYVSMLGHSSTRVLRFAKVVVSDGTAAKED